MKRTATRLADGRELIYFDERDCLARDAVDTRLLEAPPPASQLRYDPLADEWVAIAAHRQGRTFLPPASDCPLCPSTSERATEIPARDYDVVVFENRFPAFSDRGVGGPLTVPTPLTPVRAGTGRCEVVCFTSDHDASFASLPPERVRTVLAALADRTEALAAMPGVEQVFCFENRGVEIGVTLHHPHGQIYAYPFVAPRTQTMLAAARRHAIATGGRSLLGDMLTAERASGERVVVANDLWTAFVPAAARWPYEILIAPHRRVPDLTALTDAEYDAFGPLYLDVLRRLDALFGLAMPYIAAWHQAPVRIDRDLAYLHLQVFSIRRAPDKLKYLAAAESGAGIFLNDVVPEDAARQLRAAGG
jgi:UDPglucose--hexose-1-phosphate uridylyltransferase